MNAGSIESGSTDSGDNSSTVWPVDSNVVLTGFMGTGKSTVGRVIADRLGYGFVDTDDVIEARHGTIASIFNEQGEAAFRRFENDVARELASQSRLVIATGGRFMLDDRNVAALAGRCRVCCLVATTDQILERVMADSGRHERPLLQAPDPRQRIEDLLTDRDDGYRRFLRVSTGQRSPTAIAEEIVAAVSAMPIRVDQTSGGQSVFLGVGLMTVISELVGPVAQVLGDAADRFQSQIAISTGGLALCIGKTPDHVDGNPSAWVPTDIGTGVNTTGHPHTTDTVIVDAAVIQATRPGFVEWSEIFDHAGAFVDQWLGERS